jgi:hypothetical protein
MVKLVKRIHKELLDAGIPIIEARVSYYLDEKRESNALYKQGVADYGGMDNNVHARFANFDDVKDKLTVPICLEYVCFEIGDGKAAGEGAPLIIDPKTRIFEERDIGNGTIPEKYLDKVLEILKKNKLSKA